MIMKKVFNSLFVIIAAMVTFAGCAKQETDAPATSETKTVQFFANSIETKTVFGTPNDGVYPTLWSAGDEVKVLLNIEQVAGTEDKVPVTCDDLAVSATFEASFQPKDTPETYTYYAVCPADQYNGKSSKDGRITVIIPSEQEPLETTVDKKAQIIYAVATADAEQGSVDMDFHHLTAYGKLTLKNLPEDISVSEVKIVAPDDLYISGKWNYLVADGSIAAHKEATMNTLTIKTTRTTDIWFACGPVDVSGKTLTLTVTTNQGDFVKELNFPANRKFEAGKISKFTVDMTGITAGGTDEPEQPGETTAYYEKVTSAPADWSGKYLLVVEDGVNRALSGISTTSTKYGLGIEVSIDDNKIIASDMSKYEVVIDKASTTTGAYTMSLNSSLLCWTSNNTLSVNSTEYANTNWTISLDNGKLSIYNCSNSARQLLWNKTSPRFACYTGKETDGGYYYPHLYKFVDSNGGGSETPEQPKTLVSISVAGQTTSYTVGDTFKFDGTVTATYDNGSPATVTPTSVSEPDMTTVGTKEITVSYTEGEVTAKTTYTITVNEAPAGPIVATIAEFLAAEDSETVWYQLTGTISSISNTTYGNFDLTDETGTVYVYGLKESEDAGNQTFSKLGLKEGDTVTLIGNRDTYVNQNSGSEKDEVTNAYYVSHVAAPYLTVSNEAISVASTATSAEFTVDANVEWTVSCSTATATKSDNKVTVAFEANETAEAIVYEVVVNSELGNKTVTITQAAASQGGGDEGGETTGGYTLVTSLSDITTGQYVIAAKVDGTYYAMSNTYSSKINGTAVTVTDNIISESDANNYVVTITKTGDNYTIQLSGKYLSYGTSGTNFSSSTTSYNWNIVVGTYGSFRIKATTGSNRAIMWQQSGSRFGPYATTNNSGYNDIELFKLAN